MTHLALVTLEGVLADGQDLKTAFPMKWAKPLYASIKEGYRVIALTQAPQEIARWWLNQQGLEGWAAVLSWNTPMSYEDWRVDQIRDFLANGWDIGFLLDHNLDVINRVRDLGVLTLTIGTPNHPPGWKDTTQGFKPWSDVALLT